MDDDLTPYRDVRAQMGARRMLRRLPHRIVFGRRHRLVDAPMRESFFPLGDLESMSARWFSAEGVSVVSEVDGRTEHALRVRAESSRNGVQVWDGQEPVRLRPGGAYLAQGDALFVGDLVGERIWGVRIELSPEPPGAGEVASTGPGGAGGQTREPRQLVLPDATRDVLLARYHRYYRHPPQFDPQPVPWADVAVTLGLLDLRDSGDRTAVRRAVKDPQEAVTRLKHEIEAMHPGWLPPSSETQKTFHDHLRMVLELHGVLEPAALVRFDRRFPRAAVPVSG